MRTVTYGAACSLDGFIDAADGALDWLHFSPDVQDVMAKYWATVDTILMGRKTWEVAVAMGGGGESCDGGVMAPDTRTYVFSRTLTDVAQPGVHLVREDAGAFVQALKQKSGRGICVMGGGDLARSLLGAGVIDKVELNVHPVLLGSGTPLFLDAGRRIKLALQRSRALDGGCVLSTYKVLGSRSAARKSGKRRKPDG